MNNMLDKLQQAWQSQSCGTFEAKPDLLLKMRRHQRWMYFCVDMFIVSFFSAIVGWMFVSAWRDIQRGWPWLLYCAGLGWVVGYILFNRLRRRRKAAHYDQSMVAHVERSIDDIEHQMRLDRSAPWWYILPIALGCMIPPALFFVRDYGKRPLFESLMSLLGIEGNFAITFIFVYMVMAFLRRIALKGQLRELEALRALRASLLYTNE